MGIRASAGLMTLLLVMCYCQPEEPEGPSGEPLFAVETGNSLIPYVVIWTNGAAIINEPKIPADLRVYIQKEEVLHTHIGIEYRGSTSFRISDKKSFGIETWDEQGNDMDVSFFDFPPEEDFILSGHIVNLGDRFVFDRTLIYNYLGYNLFRTMGRYASRTEFVELEINGEYQGLYVFMEKLKRDLNRIAIDKLAPGDEDSVSITGGYILKIDKTAGGESATNQPLEYYLSNWEDDARYTPEISFRSAYDINGILLQIEPFRPPYHPDQYLETYFLYEHPKAEQITAAQKNYIQDYIHRFETALLTDDFQTELRTYTDYIELSSFVDYFILNELVRNVDGYRLSTFLVKERSGKLKMGPVWDLDIGYDSGDRVPRDGWVIDYNQYVSQDAWMVPFWWPRLMEDPVFRTALKERWSSLRTGVLSNAAVLNMVDGAVDYLQNNGAVTRNYTRWDQGIGIDYNSSVERLHTFLEERLLWMDGTIMENP